MWAYPLHWRLPIDKPPIIIKILPPGCAIGYVWSDQWDEVEDGLRDDAEEI